MINNLADRGQQLPSICMWNSSALSCYPIELLKLLFPEKIDNKIFITLWQATKAIISTILLATPTF